MTEEDSIPGLDFVNCVRVNDYYISLVLVGCIWLVEPDRTIVKIIYDTIITLVFT